MSASYPELFNALRPEAALVVGALSVLGLDLTLGRSRTISERTGMSLAAAAVAVVAAGILNLLGARGNIYAGALQLDTMAIATRTAVLALTLLALGIVPAGRGLRRPAEYVAIVLLACVGFLIMAAAQQLLLVFVGIELASLSLYVLTALSGRPASAEAALKYFLYGGTAAAFLLFGFSLVYGATGSIELGRIATQAAVQGPSPLLLLGLVMVLVAFGFKAAAAPFHLWAPDVYEGAPAPSAALIASASKVAGLTVFTRLLWPGLGSVSGLAPGSHAPGWATVVAAMAFISLLVGNLGALAQSNVRRLLAYSAIAHAGALLLGVLAYAASGPVPLFYYAATYGLATVGAFGVIAAAEQGGRCEELSDLAGLYRRSPFLASCLAVFILSLAGIPPLAGFFGKFGVFRAALAVGGAASTLGLLALLAIGMSAVALYYYLIILKKALVEKGEASGVVQVPVATRLSLFVAALLVLVLGVWPNLILGVF